VARTDVKNKKGNQALFADKNGFCTDLAGPSEKMPSHSVWISHVRSCVDDTLNEKLRQSCTSTTDKT